MSRSIVVYCVSDPAGSMTYPTKTEALTEAQRIVEDYRRVHDDAANLIEVQRITIDGPLTAALVCRLLSSGGYASNIETIWTAPKDPTL